MLDNEDDADSERNPADKGPNSPGPQIDASPAPESVNAGASTAAPADAATEQSAEVAAADAELDDADLRANFQEFFEIIQACTAPAVRSERWAFLGIQDDWLRIEMSPSEFIAALTQHYSIERLPHLGLLERVDGELRLPGWLDGDADLRVKFDHAVPTMSFSTGEFLFPMRRTALDYGLERIPSDSTHQLGSVFVVESQETVEVMQALGLRAVRSQGLEALGRQDIQRLFSGDQRNDFGWRYYLVLVDFDVECLENRPTAAIGEVIRRLADAADVYGIDPAHRFGVCRPSVQEFQILERAITFEDAAQIGQLFETWAAAARRDKIDSWRTHFDTEVASFSAASAALTCALQLSNDVARRAEVLVALPAYRAAGRAAVIDKIYSEIDSASDPFDTVDLMAATGFAETFLDSDPLLRAGEAVLAGQIPPSGRELQNESLEQRLHCMAELRRIRRDRKGRR